MGNPIQGNGDIDRLAADLNLPTPQETSKASLGELLRMFG
jgi:hypothetical protein